MPPLLSDESAEKIADFLAKKMSKHDEHEGGEDSHIINERTHIPLVWFLASIAAIITATFTAANWWFDFNYRQQNTVTVRYMSLYTKDLQDKNPNLKTPNAWEIMEHTHQ